MTNNDAWAIKS